MSIRDEYKAYIRTDVLKEFKEENELCVANGVKDEYIRAINTYCESKNIDLNNYIVKWLKQGRKKVLYRLLYEDDITFSLANDQIRGFISEKFELNYENLIHLENISLSEKELELVDVIFDSNEDNTRGVLFIYAYQAKQRKDNPYEDGEYIYEDIVIPVFIELDFEKWDVISRVPSKSEIYSRSLNKVEDIDIAKDIMNLVLNNLCISTNMDIMQIGTIKTALLDIHHEITELPEVITSELTNIEEYTTTYIYNVTNAIEIISDNDIIKEELNSQIKNIIKQHIISQYEDRDMFDDKYAKSLVVRATTGRSRSTIQYGSSSQRPVQETPDYQNVENLLDSGSDINKNVLQWKSIVKENKNFTVKLYTHLDGYVQVDFMEYVFEEDIQNVLSKIREFI